MKARRLIPDPMGEVKFEAPNAVVTVPSESNQPRSSNLDTYGGPWSSETMREQFGNGRATLSGSDMLRKLVGKMKTGC